MIAFLRTWRNGHIPPAFFFYNTASKSWASVSTTGSQHWDHRIISRTHTALTVPGYGSLTSGSKTPASTSLQQIEVPLMQLAVSVGCITIQEQTEIHLHNYMLCPHIPRSPFPCSLCPLEFLRAKWGDGNIVQVFSGLCQGPVVVSRHQKRHFRYSKHVSSRNTAGRSQDWVFPSRGEVKTATWRTNHELVFPWWPQLCSQQPQDRRNPGIRQHMNG